MVRDFDERRAQPRLPAGNPGLLVSSRAPTGASGVGAAAASNIPPVLRLMVDGTTSGRRALWTARTSPLGGSPGSIAATTTTTTTTTTIAAAGHP